MLVARKMAAEKPSATRERNGRGEVPKELVTDAHTSDEHLANLEHALTHVSMSHGRRSSQSGKLPPNVVEDFGNRSRNFGFMRLNVFDGHRILMSNAEGFLYRSLENRSTLADSLLMRFRLKLYRDRLNTSRIR